MSAKKEPSVWHGFKAFLMRGNVVDLAVAVVIGAAFTNIVNSLVKGIINPLVGAIGTQNLDNYSTCLKDPCKVAADGTVQSGVPILWGSVLGATLTFLITAAVVYFLMVLPMSKYLARQAARKAGRIRPRRPVRCIARRRITRVLGVLGWSDNAARHRAGRRGPGLIQTKPPRGPRRRGGCSQVVGRLLVQEALQVGGAVAAARAVAPSAVGVVRGLLVQRVVEDQRGLRGARLGFRGGAHASRVRLRRCRSGGPAAPLGRTRTGFRGRFLLCWEP